jgi:DNA-directed RNA polymerase subunit H (RpoH/RPB5)
VESHDLERLRRSLAMLPPGAKDTVLSREEAIAIIAELAIVQSQLDRVRRSLHDVLDELEE